MCQLRKWSLNCQSGQTGIPMSHSVPTALGSPLLASEAVSLRLSPSKIGMAWAQLLVVLQPAARTSVVPTLQMMPERFVVQIVKDVSENLGKVTLLRPSRKECNNLVDARTGMAEEIPRTLLLRPTCRRSGQLEHL
mmetsp:Transcript_38024/g.101306  ORF Transcript_38024/g.101306 Transcript_38024/m.101306 type:complete len:136 (-) Transcript_38024:1228-1635(-)